MTDTDPKRYKHEFELFQGGIHFEHRSGASRFHPSRVKVVDEEGNAYALYKEEAVALRDWLDRHIPTIDPAPPPLDLSTVVSPDLAVSDIATYDYKWTAADTDAVEALAAVILRECRKHELTPVDRGDAEQVAQAVLNALAGTPKIDSAMVRNAAQWLENN